MIEGRAEVGTFLWQCLQQSIGLRQHTRVIILHGVSNSGYQAVRADEFFWYSVKVAPGGISLPVQCPTCGRLMSLKTSTNRRMPDMEAVVTISCSVKECVFQLVRTMPPGTTYPSIDDKRTASEGWACVEGI